MASKLICGICETTLQHNPAGRGVVIVLCEKCQREIKMEMQVGPQFARVEELRRPSTEPFDISKEHPEDPSTPSAAASDGKRRQSARGACFTHA